MGSVHDVYMVKTIRHLTFDHSLGECFILVITAMLDGDLNRISTQLAEKEEGRYLIGSIPKNSEQLSSFWKLQYTIDYCEGCHISITFLQHSSVSTLLHLLNYSILKVA